MRVVARKAGGRVSIWSRNGRPWTTELVAIGHSNVGITLDLYRHVLLGMQDDAAAKVDATLRAALASQPSP
jgi:hypothetical protein